MNKVPENGDFLGRISFEGAPDSGRLSFSPNYLDASGPLGENRYYFIIRPNNLQNIPHSVLTESEMEELFRMWLALRETYREVDEKFGKQD